MSLREESSSTSDYGGVKVVICSAVSEGGE